jgi:hypothetical protein
VFEIALVCTGRDWRERTDQLSLRPELAEASELGKLNGRMQARLLAAVHELFASFDGSAREGALDASYELELVGGPNERLIRIVESPHPEVPIESKEEQHDA